MNDYKMQIFRNSKVKQKNTRCFDLEKVLEVGRDLFRKDRHIIKVIFTLKKKNFKVILLKNHRRTKY